MKKKEAFYYKLWFFIPAMIGGLISACGFGIWMLFINNEIGSSVVANSISLVTMIVTGITLVFLYKTLKQQQKQIDKTNQDLEFNRALDIIKNCSSIDIPFYKETISDIKKIADEIELEERYISSRRINELEYFLELEKNNRGKNSLNKYCSNIIKGERLISRFYTSYLQSLRLLVKIIYNENFSNSDRNILIEYLRTNLKINGVQFDEFKSNIAQYWMLIVCERQLSNQELFEYYFKEKEKSEMNWNRLVSIFDNAEDRYYFTSILFQNNPHIEEIIEIKKYYKLE
ncbi:hypothetical protein [Sphingobacterium cellulitidis]|uniref:Phage abortive infection protein n=1 Tax=Sphingobacterium cellulitidis TaxID=1768011 RepID=A0A8H9KV48_9SPHI|nr:hypothetical protein [Sphingobacterium soli]MBA8985984.1 hypothetical protein [Sphingobacterium soli]GGE28108.1 hypothetical protein GCM10011516_27210 [Sphingobacterium soli]